MSEKVSEKVKRYRILYRNACNRKIRVKYMRKREVRHTLVGVILNVRKSSIIILQEDNLKVNIGFRNIKESLFLDNCNKIKLNLYYGIKDPNRKPKKRLRCI